MINLTNVSKIYGTEGYAVRDLNLEVKEGEIMGIIGHNGAGKSTVLKMICGLIAPTSGRINVMDRDMSKSNDAIYVQQRLGFLPEESSLYHHMTVLEYLKFFAELYKVPPKQAEKRIDSLLNSLQLRESYRLTGELSKGMKRKVSIARVLLHDPDLLILDEPNSGLDPMTSFFIINYLIGLREQGKTILLSAHNLFHIEYICDRVSIIKDGRLLVCDTMTALQDSLGRREYEVIFKTDEVLPFDSKEGNYYYKTDDVTNIISILSQISENNWDLVNLSVHQSALEEIYVKLINGVN
jgi:ABC-2 type transport system ATP-binding protein